MLTQLQQLETALAKERQAQAEENNTLDDASYQRVRKEMDTIRDRIAVMAKTRQLKTEAGSSIRADEERREQDAKIDKFLQERFGDKTKAEAD
jgi:tRNA(Ser,Leu) C12 N-acetylase TAN1